MYSSLDTETNGTELIRLKHKPFFVSACTEEGIWSTWSTDVDPYTREPQWGLSQIVDMQEYVDSYSLVFHNKKFDRRALENIGVTVVAGDDTLLASHVLDNLESHDLKDLCIRYLDIFDDDELKLKSTIKEALTLYNNQVRLEKVSPDWQCTKEYGPAAWQAWLPKALYDHLVNTDRDEQLIDCYEHFRTALTDYGSIDASRTIQLWLFLQRELVSQDYMKQYVMELRTGDSVYEMESRGITLRTDVLDSEYKRYSAMVDDSEKRVLAMASKGFKDNGTYSEKLLRSPKQLQTLLYVDWKIRPIYQTKTGLSTDASTLTELESQPGLSERAKKGLETLLEHRSADTARKYLANYKGLMVDGRLHPSYNQTGTKTTRFSHSNPNNANVGKGEDQYDDEGNKIREFKLRSVFGPAEGRVWFPIDYKQLQLLLFAYSVNDPQMKLAFKKGYDFHKYVASKIFSKPIDKISDLEKRIGKNVNFGFIFGAGPDKIEATAGMPGLWDTVCEMFPLAHEYMNKTIAEVRKNKYVHTLSGRRLWIPRMYGKVMEYVGVNYQIQGDEGIIVKKAMRDCHEYLQQVNRDGGIDSFMTMQIHDELIFDFPELPFKHLQNYIAVIVSLMESAGRVCNPTVPTKVSVTYVPYGKSWADAEPWESNHV